MMTPKDMAALHAAVFTMPRPWSEGEFADLVASPFVFALGDERGFVLGRAIAGEAEVLTLAVAPEARRHGVARGLMAGFVAQAVLRGAKSAFLEVAESNAAAIGLYEGCGFAISGRRKGYFRTLTGEKQDALVMTRALDAAAPGVSLPDF